jgi:hypothetical protein
MQFLRGIVHYKSSIKGFHYFSLKLRLKRRFVESTPVGLKMTAAVGGKKLRAKEKTFLVSGTG